MAGDGVISRWLARRNTMVQCSIRLRGSALVNTMQGLSMRAETTLEELGQTGIFLVFLLPQKPGQNFCPGGKWIRSLLLSESTRVWRSSPTHMIARVCVASTTIPAKIGAGRLR